MLGSYSSSGEGIELCVRLLSRYSLQPMVIANTITEVRAFAALLRSPVFPI